MPEHIHYPFGRHELKPAIACEGCKAGITRKAFSKRAYGRYYDNVASRKARFRCKVRAVDATPLDSTQDAPVLSEQRTSDVLEHAEVREL